jgi:hypothetical protein
VSRITDYALLTSPQSDDLLIAVDVHDTSMSAAGTSKRVTFGSVAALGLAPSGVTTGVTDTANVQGALNLASPGARVVMQAGQWYWNATVTVPVKVTLEMPDSYRVAGSKISLTAGFTGTSAVAFAAGTPCGGVRGLVIDGSSLPAGSVDGIAVTVAAKFGNIEGVNIGHMTGHGINLTAGTGNPDGWSLRDVSAHDNGGDGIHWDYAVDGQLDTFHLDHNTGSGLSLGTMNNCTFTGGKCQQNTNYGYALTGGFVKSNATFTACFSENNAKDGWNFSTSGGGQGSIQLIGCSTRDDGTSGTSGSGYAGFSFTVARADILMAACSNYVTASTAGPDYGLKLANCTGNVNITGCSLIGGVAAYSNGGGNTLVRWNGTTVSSGQNDATRTIAQAPALPASFQPSGPAATTSATLVMMGLGSTCVYTPRGSGSVLVTVTGILTDSAAGNCTLGGRYGTGTAPANGAAVSGTRFGSGSIDFTVTPAAGGWVPFALTQLIALTPGTAYWFDLALAVPAAATASVKAVSMTIAEQP